MALHPDFPHSPHAVLDPDIRWFPADEALCDTPMDKLMPPLVAQLRRKVKEEAIETIVYLHDVVGAKDKYDLMRFEASGSVSAGMFDESWRRWLHSGIIDPIFPTHGTLYAVIVCAWLLFSLRYVCVC